MHTEHPTVTKYLDEILATKEDLSEYQDKTQPSHLRQLLKDRRELSDSLKSHRWLGFIQGVMVARGWLNVDEERDRTRPYFTQENKA